jgi:hypothetical protein
LPRRGPWGAAKTRLRKLPREVAASRSSLSKQMPIPRSVIADLTRYTPISCGSSWLTVACRAPSVCSAKLSRRVPRVRSRAACGTAHERRQTGGISWPIAPPSGANPWLEHTAEIDSDNVRNRPCAGRRQVTCASDLRIPQTITGQLRTTAKPRRTMPLKTPRYAAALRGPTRREGDLLCRVR